MASKLKPSTLIVILAFATVYIVWGSTYFFIRVALTGFTPFILGTFRFIIAALIMFSWCVYKKEKIFDINIIRHAAVSGVLLLFVANGVVIWVEQYLPSALVAILVSAAPLWFVLLDRGKWKENFKNTSTVVGILVGFIGVIVLFYEKVSGSVNLANNTTDVVSLTLLIIGSMAWAGGSLYSKNYSSDASASVTTVWQMFAGGVAFLPAALLNNEFRTFTWQNISPTAGYAVAYLVIFGSIAAFSAYVWLLQVRPATQVSTYAYVNPIVAVLLGVFFAAERISMLQVLGLVIILGSVLLINIAKYRNNKTELARG